MFKKLIPYLFAFFGGILYATGFPMFGDSTFILGPFLAFALLNWSLESHDSIRKQLFLSWIFALGFYTMGFYWIPFLLKEFGGLFPPFNYLLGIVFSVIILPQVYIYTLLKRNFKNIFALSFIYALLEYFVPQQFPAHLGHSFMSLSPKLNLFLAPVFGAPIYTFIICSIALNFLFYIKFKKIAWFQFSISFSLLILSLLPINLHKNFGPKIDLSLRIVQPNIGNFLKIDSEKGNSNSLKSVFESYYDLSTKNPLRPLDLIIWPETAFPTLMSSQLLKASNSNEVPLLIKQIVQKTGSEMFIGGYDFNLTNRSFSSFESEFNAGFYFSKEARLKDVYRKMQLIPFGEGLPFGRLNEFLSKYITNVSFFAKGDRPTLFNLPENKGTFKSAICYEILFPELIREILNKDQINPDFLINLTNDSWYGDTSEPYQHLFLAKWRAIEFNLPFIRSTNTGVTTIIYPNGSESSRIGIFEKTFRDYNFIFSKHEKTIYQKFGIWSFILLCLILCLIEKSLLLKGHVNE